MDVGQISKTYPTLEIAFLKNLTCQGFVFLDVIFFPMPAKTAKIVMDEKNHLIAEAIPANGTQKALFKG